jgi:hypothetical protein
MKHIFKNILIYFIDILFSPFTFFGAIWFKLLRKYNIGFFKTISPFSKLIFEKVGVFPIIDHYYEPSFNKYNSITAQRADRKLPGINFNVEKQLGNLRNFNFNSEIIEISKLEQNQLNYSFSKGPFLSGDSEILFNIIRLYQPKKIIEIGCGHSSLMIQHAVKYNKFENQEYKCNHICIEPYEAEWIEKLDIEFIKKPVENLDLKLFESLESGDILFIDSTHIIRPQGDVLFEYLEILPIIKSGVLVHIHDIFTPKDYLDEWVRDGVNFWNEQYLLEAFLSCNKEFEIICALNFLKHNYYDELAAKCPMLNKNREPGSFWMIKS